MTGDVQSDLATPELKNREKLEYFHIRILLLDLKNYTCIKSSISNQVYKVFNTYAHEILGWTILSILIHERIPHLGGMNGDVKYDLSTLAFNNVEKKKIFISDFSEFNRKVTSLEKLYLLHEFSSST